jgi:hypothetical protein
MGRRPRAGGSVIDQAAQWGANQELEAGVNYIDNNISGNKARKFRADRRPKPPSLKEQALEALKALPTPAGQVTADRLDTIRRALLAQPVAEDDVDLYLEQ